MKYVDMTMLEKILDIDGLGYSAAFLELRGIPTMPGPDLKFRSFMAIANGKWDPNGKTPKDLIDYLLFPLPEGEERDKATEKIIGVFEKFRPELEKKFDEAFDYIRKQTELDDTVIHLYMEQYLLGKRYGTTYRFVDFYQAGGFKDVPKPIPPVYHYDQSSLKPTLHVIKRDDCVEKFGTGNAPFDFMDYYVQNLQGDRTEYKLSDIKIEMVSAGKLLAEVEPSKVITEGGKVYLEVGKVEKNPDITLEFTTVDVTGNKAAQGLAEKILKRRGQLYALDVTKAELYHALFGTNIKFYLKCMGFDEANYLLAGIFNGLLHDIQAGNEVFKLDHLFDYRDPNRQKVFNHVVKNIELYNEQLKSLIEHFSSEGYTPLPYDVKEWLRGYFNSFMAINDPMVSEKLYPELGNWIIGKLGSN